MLTYASAIAFQVLASLIPLTSGPLDLGFMTASRCGARTSLQFEAQVSKEVYAVVDEVVERTLGQERGGG